jgi:cytochrome c-type biogenesis protein CcmE
MDVIGDWKVKMTRKQRRISLLIAAALVLSASATLVITTLQNQIVYFVAPSDLDEQKIAPGQRMRLGGLVAEGSLDRYAGQKIIFDVTDLVQTVSVSYTGILPDLFREGQGVVAEGVFDEAGGFKADTILAKHDENYMPKEVAEALKEKGVWQSN